MRVFIYACENIYSGLHGMYDCTVVEVSSEDEIGEYGVEMSFGVMESYDSIIDILEARADEVNEDRDSEEWAEAYEEGKLENLSWNAWKINEEVVKDISTDELDEIASNNEYSDFVKEYCGEEI